MRVIALLSGVTLFVATGAWCLLGDPAPFSSNRIPAVKFAPSLVDLGSIGVHEPRPFRSVVVNHSDEPTGPLEWRVPCDCLTVAGGLPRSLAPHERKVVEWRFEAERNLGPRRQMVRVSGEDRLGARWQALLEVRATIESWMQVRPSEETIHEVMEGAEEHVQVEITGDPPIVIEDVHVLAPLRVTRLEGPADGHWALDVVLSPEIGTAAGVVESELVVSFSAGPQEYLRVPIRYRVVPAVLVEPPVVVVDRDGVACTVAATGRTEGVDVRGIRPSEGCPLVIQNTAPGEWSVGVSAGEDTSSLRRLQQLEVEYSTAGAIGTVKVPVVLR